MSYELTHTTDIELKIPPSTGNLDNYSNMLDELELEYSRSDVYLQVGEIRSVQGWILHVSVVRSQIQGLLYEVLPLLASWKTAFKVVPDKDTAHSMLNGNLGIERVGKILCIYPETDEAARQLVKELIRLTKNFKGPKIPTDLHLGSAVYTRYGSFNPISKQNADGHTERYIYNKKGELIKDTYNIPFSLEKDNIWPFDEFASPLPKSPKKILNVKYKPHTLLKLDPKGNVFKSLYLKNIINIKWCVLKEGKKDMWSDDAGRDMRDRLAWQSAVHKKLEGSIPIPRIFDLFEEDGNSYIAMQYINGPSLIKYVFDLNKLCKPWQELPSSTQITILNLILQILHIVDAFHVKGLVHRDISPANFLVSRKEVIYIIDNELAYSIPDKSPIPPYEMGTYGFMSPEQLLQLTPTVKEDIYAIGGCMIILLTGLSPLVVNSKNTTLLTEHLNFLIGKVDLCNTISLCLSTDPERRPALKDIKRAILTFKEEVKNNKGKKTSSLFKERISERKLQHTIQSGITGLVMPPTVIQNDLWHSKLSDPNNVEKEKTGFIKRAGLATGISGVLYFLAKAKKCGYNVDDCKSAIDKGWDYVIDATFQDIQNIASGLYAGSTGVAMALATNFSAGSIPDTQQNRLLLTQLFEAPPVGMDLSSGLSGHGIALIHCKQYLDINFFDKTIIECVQTLLNQQQKDGLWMADLGPYEKKYSTIDLVKRNAGIIFFLLQYLRLKDDYLLIQSIKKAISGIQRHFSEIRQTLIKEGYRNLAQGNPAFLEALQGYILVYLNAYSVLGDNNFRKTSLILLNQYNGEIVQDNFTQLSGLSGLGELYLEAYKVFKEDIWLDRAHWLASLLMHAAHEENDYCYWLGNNFRFPTAELLTGNSGILHFLMRYSNPEITTYRILGCEH